MTGGDVIERRLLVSEMDGEQRRRGRMTVSDGEAAVVLMSRRTVPCDASRGVGRVRVVTVKDGRSSGKSTGSGPSPDEMENSDGE